MIGEMGKDFCTNFLQPLFENINRRSCNDGNLERNPVFYRPYRKGRPSHSAVALILEFLVGVPSKAASSSNIHPKDPTIPLIR